MSLTRKPRARTRTHPAFDVPLHRIKYCIWLMATRQWETGVTTHELVEDWGLALATIEDYSTQASRHFELLGQRDALLDLVRYHSLEWIEERGKDRVPAARLLLETVGALTQKHEVSVTPQLPDAEMVPGVIAWLKQTAPNELLIAADEIRGLILTSGKDGSDE